MKELLESRTARLSLKGVPFYIEEAAEEEKVNEMELHVQLVDRNIEQGKYQQVHMKSRLSYKH